MQCHSFRVASGKILICERTERPFVDGIAWLSVHLKISIYYTFGCYACLCWKAPAKLMNSPTKFDSSLFQITAITQGIDDNRLPAFKRANTFIYHKHFLEMLSFTGFQKSAYIHIP
jgi:hypothetical protein